MQNFTGSLNEVKQKHEKRKQKEYKIIIIIIVSIQPVVTTASNIFKIFHLYFHSTEIYSSLQRATAHIVPENDVEIDFPWKFILDNQLSIKYPTLAILL